MTFRVAFLSAGLLAFAALSRGMAAEPVEVPVGDLVVVRTASAERWYISAHGGTKRNVLVITVSASGDVSMSTIPLPDSTDKPDDPDDPDPPPADLAALVKKWADQINDPSGRMKLAVAYQQLIKMIDAGQIANPTVLVTLQSAANSLMLGGSAAKWLPFFEHLREHLNANPPADLPAYRAAWQFIVEGLQSGSAESISEALQSIAEGLE